jgi:hypothetical protein
MHVIYTPKGDENIGMRVIYRKIGYLCIIIFNFVLLSCSVSGEGPNFGISQEEKYATRGKLICRFDE